MILYVIRFTVAITLIYLFYKGFLEKEKSYRFNRFYLLAGLPISLIIPTLSLFSPNKLKVMMGEFSTDIAHVSIPFDFWLVSLYLLVLLILLIRFIIDIRSFYLKIKNSQKVVLDGAVMVLVNEKTSPYTFFNYIFVNKDQYTSLPLALLTHELAHIKQKHSWDVVAIEMAKIVFWFLPILRLYKQAMQLNHELLADQFVLSANMAIRNYQELLLQHSISGTSILASGFNFNFTKKRLKMMGKKQGRFQFIKQILVVPIILLTILACTDNRGVTGKEMLFYWRYTANMQEILQTGSMNQKDLDEGIILPIETKAQYDKLQNIYTRMNNDQKTSVYPLPPFIEPIED